MKQMTILSGKGGTGKTTITASFATLAENSVVADCDVDAPDLHMLLHPEVIETQEFKGSKLALIDEDKCTECGLCREKCRFDAVTEDIRIDPISCEGCGICVLICPLKAVKLTDRVVGHAYISKSKYGYMSHALLKPGEANSGKLVSVVRQNARKLAKKDGNKRVIVDGPPGTGCPVIASVTGVDIGLVVSEPTMSGIHDLERALQLLNHFDVPSVACVNMCDVNWENTEKIVDFCEANKVKVMGKIPFNPVVTEAMVNGKPVVEYAPNSDVAQEISKMWGEINTLLKTESE
ncbi:MAG: P-loop NTPase [Thermoproteota archaeon]